MRTYVTLFDSAYLTRGVVLAETLSRHGGDHELLAYCFDELAHDVLTRLALPSVTPLTLAELEAADPQLLKVKGGRTRAEYCWTATPSILLHALSLRPEATDVTYLDADLRFFSSPEPLFDELRDRSVLITPHRYAPEYVHHEAAGIYNVQFVTFRRDPDGLAALQWWHDRCIEWCFHRVEEHRNGDQKYLDDWPDRFPGVHVLRHPGGGLAPWNASNHRVDAGSDRADDVTVDDVPLVFFHFHGLRLRASGRHELHPAGFHVPARVRSLVYEPYLADLAAALSAVQGLEPGFAAGLEAEPTLRARAGRTRARVSERVTSRLSRARAESA